MLARVLGKPAIINLQSHTVSSFSSLYQTTAIPGIQPATGKITTKGMTLLEKENIDGFHLLCADGKTYLNTGDTVTIDGSHGIVYKGNIPKIASGQDADYQVTHTKQT